MFEISILQDQSIPIAGNMMIMAFRQLVIKQSELPFLPLDDVAIVVIIYGIGGGRTTGVYEHDRRRSNEAT